jgi:nitrite reductase/ring-hydroxylating ferredoxin subunit
MRILAGAPDAVAHGQVYVIPLPRDAGGAPREALLLRDGTGQLRSYLNRCQHLPITLDAGGRRFLTADGAYLQCRTHGARYRPDDGHCIYGPCAGRALQSLTIELDAGLVYIVVDG